MATVNASAISFLILCLSSLSITEAKGGFSLDLIRRDAPKSPFYSPDETYHQRVTKALKRSVNRVSHFDPAIITPNTAQADIISALGEYVMNISIGTPPVEILAIADTGSDLIWTQCKPCTECYKQAAPFFDPEQSSTYKDLSCDSRQCTAYERTSCSTEETCEYSATYGDRSFSNGNLAVETVTLGSTNGRPVALRNIIFGCGHNDDGTFNENATGIVGLGGGSVSLVTQMGSSIGGKFSYCLVPFLSSESSSKINFGSNGVVSGTGVVTTPLVAKDPDTFYFLTLEAISVGTKKIHFDDASEGNIIIDSGTTLTFLPPDIVSKLTSAVSDLIKADPISDPEGVLDLCYPYSSDFKAPQITVHFSGADVVLSPENTFIRTSDTTVCFTFKGMEGQSIYGNLAQANFLVGYDTKAKTVSFKPTDCSK